MSKIEILRGYSKLSTQYFAWHYIAIAINLNLWINKYFPLDSCWCLTGRTGDMIVGAQLGYSTRMQFLPVHIPTRWILLIQFEVLYMYAKTNTWVNTIMKPYDWAFMNETKINPLVQYVMRELSRRWHSGSCDWVQGHMSTCWYHVSLLAELTQLWDWHILLTCPRLSQQ